MPDPLLIAKSLAAALAASVVLTPLLRRLFQRWGTAGEMWAMLLATAGAAVTGLAVGAVVPRWLPVNGLDRLLCLVLPGGLAVEALLFQILRGSSRTVRSRQFVIRFVAALAGVFTLLYGSVHLQTPLTSWDGAVVRVTLLGWSFWLALAWQAVSDVSQREPRLVVPWTVAITIQVAGVLIMMAGYLKGGAAAAPLAAAIAGAGWWGTRARGPESLAAVAGLGVMMLFGLVLIGRYFGGLTTGVALTLCSVPLITWTHPAAPSLLGRPKLDHYVRCFVIAIVLAILLAQGKAAFDRKFRKLVAAPVPAYFRW